MLMGGSIAVFDIESMPFHKTIGTYEGKNVIDIEHQVINDYIVLYFMTKDALHVLTLK